MHKLTATIEDQTGTAMYAP